jgi:hypothetical protein
MDREATDLAMAEAIPLYCETVALRIAEEQLGSFFPLLQRGVTVQAEVGCSLRELLCGQFGIPADYVAGRITTIFLDNRPVDVLDSTIREGARVALSAAMPGLVGAVMRRSGFYAALRQGISHSETAGETKAGSGTVRLKLFNLLLPELAPLILARGVLLERQELDGLLGELSAPSRMGIASSYRCERDACGGILLSVSFKK